MITIYVILFNINKGGKIVELQEITFNVAVPRE